MLKKKRRTKYRTTGFAVYRAVVDANQLKENPKASQLLEKPNLNLWYYCRHWLKGKGSFLFNTIGDSRHVMTYVIRGGSVLT
jgi:hypothetical protein